jgi:hypothetical protein
MRDTHRILGRRPERERSTSNGGPEVVPANSRTGLNLAHVSRPLRPTLAKDDLRARRLRVSRRLQVRDLDLDLTVVDILVASLALSGRVDHFPRGERLDSIRVTALDAAAALH